MLAIPIEDFMKILGIIFMIGMFVTFIRLMISMYALSRVSRELTKLINKKGLQFKSDVRGIKRIRQQHAAVNSEASLQLMSEAEKVVPIFVWRFRFFLIFMVLLGIVTITMK